MDNRTKSNYNKIEYCLGNGLELLSAPTVFAVCQDSSVLIDFAVIDFEGATVIDKGNYRILELELPHSKLNKFLLGVNPFILSGIELCSLDLYNVICNKFVPNLLTCV